MCVLTCVTTGNDIVRSHAGGDRTEATGRLSAAAYSQQHHHQQQSHDRQLATTAEKTPGYL